MPVDFANVSIEAEINRATELGQKLENLVVQRGSITFREGLAANRGQLLAAFWALGLDYHKGILALLGRQYFSSAFALARPADEALIRAHLVLTITDDQVAAIENDQYRTNFREVIPTIDQKFGYNGLLTRTFDQKALNALHSYTHSGLSQLGRRFIEGDLGPSFTECEITELIRHTCSVTFMLTTLLTKTCGLDTEARAASQLYIAWGTATQTTN